MSDINCEMNTIISRCCLFSMKYAETITNAINGDTLVKLLASFDITKRLVVIKKSIILKYSFYSSLSVKIIICKKD